MRPVRLVFVVLLAAVPLAAQTDFTIFGARGTATSTITPAGKIRFTDGRGYGVAATHFLSDQFAVELSASEVRYDGTIELNAQESLSLGHLRIRPLAAVLQWHVGRAERLDPYVGAGIAYVVASNLSSSELDSSGIGTVAVKSGFAPAIDAGVNLSLTRNVLLAGDVKYLRFRPDSGPPGARQQLDLKPVVVAVGVRWRL